MTKTLLSRISNLNQYDPITKTILYLDDIESRWQNVYGHLQINDNAIFIGTEKIFVGNVSQVNLGRSILCSDVEEIICSNDHFLQLNEIYPELISRVKASFQPFIHPKQINIVQLIRDAHEKKFVSYFILSDVSMYEKTRQNYRLNDRILLIDKNNKLENVKLHSNAGLIEFPDSESINISVKGLTFDQILDKNISFKRKSTKSNNVERIKKIIETISIVGVYKFNTFFSYYDCLFNKKVYGEISESLSSIREIVLKNNEIIYKVSMSDKDIDGNTFEYCMENHIIIVHGDTGAKGLSKETQGESFEKKMNKGDYFYLCRGNSSLELIGRIISEAVPFDYEDFGDSGWLQRSYEIVADAQVDNSYQGIKKWWTPNENSTCIAIPNQEIEDANKKIFIPFFNSQFVNNEIYSKNETNRGSMKIALNQILYGPPGTGKTYKTINKALEIIGENIANKSRLEIIELFDAKMNEGRIVFTTFHQSMSYEDFVEGIKPIVPKNEGDPVIYKNKDGLFRKLCIEASFDMAVLNGVRNQKPISKMGKEVCDFSFEEKKEIVSSLSKSDYKSNAGKPFVFIIDEINRGNVSQIFGELITLIEENKRLGNEESLEVVLPYSKEKFGVPANLYIIGTMNTADRSVEALDTALRRRFSFEELLPKPELIEVDSKLLSGIILKDLLTIINMRIEKLSDSDHQIGHSYFMTVSDLNGLKEIFANKIIPLLKEYFFGDFGKIGLILGEDFFDLENNFQNTFFAKFNEVDGAEYSERTIFKIKDVSKMENEDFVNAINKLMRK